MIERIGYLLEILTILWCIYSIYGRKLQLNIKNIALISLYVILLQAVNDNSLPEQCTFFLQVLIFIYMCIEFGYSKREILVNNVLYIVVVCIIQILSWILLVMLQLENTEPDIQLFLANFISIVIAILALPHCKLETLSQYLQQKNSLVNLVLVVCSGFVIYMLVVFKSLNFLVPENYIIISVSIGVILLLVYQWQQNQFKVKEQTMELQMHQLYDESFQNLLTEIREKQHDFRNHINAVYNQHYVCTTFEELVAEQGKYCNQMMKNNKYNELLKIGKSTIIGFLYGKFMEADAKGIDVEYKIAIQGLECCMPEYKFVEIIGNLFDNAVEALENDEANKKIFLGLMERKESIVFRISNKSKYLTQKKLDEMFQMGKSSKGGNRGIGLSNVKKICDEYHCILRVQNKEKAEDNYIEFRIEVKK